MDTDEPGTGVTLLRIPEDVAERIKQAAKARPIKTSSHTLIVEAVLEKLKKEGF